MASGTPNARITVSLIPKAEDALTELHNTTGMSKSDLVNRSIQAYNFLQTVEASQGQILIHRPDGKTEHVQFL